MGGWCSARGRRALSREGQECRHPRSSGPGGAHYGRPDLPGSPRLRDPPPIDGSRSVPSFMVSTTPGSNFRSRRILGSDTVSSGSTRLAEDPPVLLLSSMDGGAEDGPDRGACLPSSDHEMHQRGVESDMLWMAATLQCRHPASPIRVAMRCRDWLGSRPTCSRRLTLSTITTLHGSADSG